MKSTYQILWPDYRVVPSETIVGWYADAVANGDAAEGCITPDEMAAALNQAGLITLKEAAWNRAVQKDAPVRRQRRATDELPESDVLYGESPDY